MKRAPAYDPIDFEDLLNYYTDNSIYCPAVPKEYTSYAKFAALRKYVV